MMAGFVKRLRGFCGALIPADVLKRGDRDDVIVTLASAKGSHVAIRNPWRFLEFVNHIMKKRAVVVQHIADLQDVGSAARVVQGDGDFDDAFVEMGGIVEMKEVRQARFRARERTAAKTPSIFCQLLRQSHNAESLLYFEKYKGR